MLAAADVVVLPFRRVTTSGSAMLALSHGRPLIVPDLPGLADLPDEAVLRYDGGVPELIAAIGVPGQCRWRDPGGDVSRSPRLRVQDDVA